MRKPERLSYSGMNTWEARPDEFYLKYLCERRSPKVPQERPAAVGSAFDAIVKSALHAALNGPRSDPKYDLTALYEAQVEPQNRTWAMPEGLHVFECYKVAGFYDTLLGQLQVSAEPPRFEFTVEAVLNGVPFTGKPDCGWVTPGLVRVIHDFKVNGYCGKGTTSPHKSYMLCMDGWIGKQSKSHGTEHNAFLAKQHGDITINTSYLEAANAAWADQLSLYAWAMGEPIGGETVLSIHQITAKAMSESRPQLRMSQFRALVAREYQLRLAARLKRCWDAITSGHVFADLSRGDSDARCATLDAAAVGLQTDGSSLENYFSEATRQGYFGK
jgi:hypothetical protein